jgi:hypothetical protein
MKDETRKVYVQPTLEKRERLAEVTETVMFIPTVGLAVPH